YYNLYNKINTKIIKKNVVVNTIIIMTMKKSVVVNITTMTMKKNVVVDIITIIMMQMKCLLLLV
ncbi:MAG: hypothetical protein K2I77_06810, partial [Anaeroplasmataceae bacterium]|nr:hypothetical protein [Anaeroplasmataceae bacterium]